MRSALQLHSVRDIDAPLPNVVRRVGAAGFEGVEFAGRVTGANAEDMVAALDETSLEAMGAHVSLHDLEADPEAVARRYRRLGVTRLVIPHLRLAHFRTPARVDALADRLNDLGARLDACGSSLVYHNQLHDFVPPGETTRLQRLLTAVHPYGMDASKPQTGIGLVGDHLFKMLGEPDSVEPVERTAFGRLVSATDPDRVSFEVDVGTAHAAGQNPVEVLRFVGERTPLVHLKDTTVKGERGPLAACNSVDPGTGDVDLNAALSAAREIGAEWSVFEHDSPADPVQTIQDGETLFGVERHSDDQVY